MYHMKNIVSFADELVLPKCMYHLKNPINTNENIEINISDQVTKFLKKMPNKSLYDLEDRQDKLLLKIDILFERIKIISSLCAANSIPIKKEAVNNITIKKEASKGPVHIVLHEEIVLVLNSDDLPWYLNIFLKKLKILNVSWHIHSSVINNSSQKIEAFFRKFRDLYRTKPESNINIRLIFKSESAEPELKISSLGVPILGNVNIIRYLCLIYPDIVPYDHFNHETDGLLDYCHQLRTTSEKRKADLLAKIFEHYDSGIFNNTFSIVDLVTFSAIKQIQNGNKYVSKKWLNECEKLFL